MNWSHIQLVFTREMRDQLRDRRTMFTICVLPLLLYPLMGLLMLQLAQVKTPQRFTIAVVEQIDKDAFEDIVRDPTTASDNSLRWSRWPSESELGAEILASLPGREEPKEPTDQDGPSQQVPGSVDHARVEGLLRKTQADAILCVSEPRDETSDLSVSSLPLRFPHFLILSNQRLERSRLAVLQLQKHIDAMHGAWARAHLLAQHIDSSVWNGPRIVHLDVATSADRQALVWSKLLPFIMLVWALTGAFYPAVDLCAGEKERGTLETLLSSPASRREIVWGKLLTIMCFSIATALLNLMSMVVTTSFVMRHWATSNSNGAWGAVGPISFDLIVWLVLLVVPMSAMFSALALAVASLARSTKEGQYYLMPLMLVGFPLVMLPALPGITLSSGTSIVPVTGAVLLSRALMDGEYATALAYLPSVLCVTTLCCLLATRWAVRQFENESVLFSETEKGSMKNWLIRMWIHRSSHPSATESVLCGLAILVGLFFGRLAMGAQPFSWDTFATSTVVIQIGLMLGPTLIMAVMLTRSVRVALRLNLPRIDDLIACTLLAVCLHPTYVRLANLVNREYPLGPETIEALQQFDGVLASVPFLSILLVLALLPAVCEELVFRGFVFSGLLENKGVLRAVIGSAVLFGLSHGVLQQTICATIMGLLMGWMAYRTGSVVCTILFHFLHKALTMTITAWSSSKQSFPEALDWFIGASSESFEYSQQWTNASVAVSLILIFWLSFRSQRSLGRVSVPVAEPGCGTLTAG